MNLHFPTLFCSIFPHWEDKRAGNSKNLLLFFTLFFYIPWIKRLKYAFVEIFSTHLWPLWGHSIRKFFKKHSLWDKLHFFEKKNLKWFHEFFSEQTLARHVESRDQPSNSAASKSTETGKARPKPVVCSLSPITLYKCFCAVIFL